MKRSGKCPKCGSGEVIGNARVLERMDGIFRADLAVSTYRNPEAMLFKGEQRTAITIWVCIGCGFIELYAAEPNELRITPHTERDANSS